MATGRGGPSSGVVELLGVEGSQSPATSEKTSQRAGATGRADGRAGWSKHSPE